MGGENSPKKNLEGVNLFIKRYLKEKDYFFYLHGDENKINKIISNYKYLNSNYKIIDTKIVVQDDLPALSAIKKGKNSSMWEKFMKSSNLGDFENKKHNFKKYNLIKNFNIYFKNLEKTLKNRNNLQIKTIKKFTVEFNKLNKVLYTKDINKIKLTINKFDILFKGYNGVPSNYIAGYKIK